MPLAQQPWRRWGVHGWQALANILRARGVQVCAVGLGLDGADLIAANHLEAKLQRGPWRVIIADVNPLLDQALRGLWPVVVLAGPDAIDTKQALPPHWVVRSPAYCSPCQQMGCRNRPDSPAVCLDWLSLRTVLRAVDAALELPRLVQAEADRHPHVTGSSVEF